MRRVLGDRRRLASAAAVLGALVILAVLVVARAGQIGPALGDVSLAAIDGHLLARDAVHGANAVAFVAGALESHSAMPARVALLRRLAPARAPRPAQMAMAELPLFLLEVAAAAVAVAAGSILAGLGGWWLGPVGLALAAVVLLAGRHATGRFSHRPVGRGLAVLAEPRRRVLLTGWVGAITALGLVRVGVALAACGAPAGPGEAAAAFAALGVFGLLPLGPTASAGATLAVTGGAAAGLAAGLVIAATSLAAVLVYGVLVVVVVRGRAYGRHRARRRAWLVHRRFTGPARVGSNL